MRGHFFAAIFLLAAIPALGQNQAPVSADTGINTTPAQRAKAATDAQKAAATARSGEAPEGKPIVLDSVVAIVNGDVLLQSDVEEERRFESLQLLPANENNDERAAEHLITRTLILQQMKEQDQNPPAVAPQALAKSIAELKKQLPGCQGRCETPDGWASFLSERGLTPTAVEARWRQRLVIFDFLNQRFRSGVRVPEDQVESYYNRQLVPQFQAKHEKAPPLKTLQPRIEEILLQEQVTKQIDDWEATLRQEGSVRILVPAYGQSSSHAEDADDSSGGPA